jgi:hypothetical protein
MFTAFPVDSILLDVFTLRVQAMDVLFPPSCCHFILLKARHTPSTLFSNMLTCFSFNVTYQLSYSYKTAGKDAALCIGFL